MEIKDTLLKPFTDKQRADFVVKNNHQHGYEIKETEQALEAWGLTAEEAAEQQAQQEAERISHLHLTRGDVFRGLLQAKGVTRAQLRAMIEALPETTNEQSLAKEMALIDFDEALNFYRGVALIDTIGAQLNISSGQMTMFFQTGDYHYLLDQEEESNEEE
jgi:hypothetical protein